ncbi:MAG: hypothetical protein ACK5MR_04085 [Cumulibacter sp.]
MRLGVMALATDWTMPPADLAVAVEERGLSSLFLPEHTPILDQYAVLAEKFQD